MRSTIDEYINKINEDFGKTYFFSKYYRTKRSRLAFYLESVKVQLIRNNELSVLELEKDIKSPIVRDILVLTNSEKQILTDDLLAEINILIQTIKAAQSPHAIESIVAGHIRSYLQADEKRVAIGHLFENALLQWQAQGLLPSMNEYKIFLEKLAHNRHQIEHDLQTLLHRVRLI